MRAITATGVHILMIPFYVLMARYIMNKSEEDAERILKRENKKLMRFINGRYSRLG